MSFDALSNELIIEICEHLSWNQDLSNLSRCSRRFHGSVLPALYSTIVQSKRQAVPYFLRTIRVKPDLAKYVRYFEGCSLESFQNDGESANLDLLFPGEEEATRQWVRSVLQEDILDSAFSNSWYQRIIWSRRNWDAVVAFLFLLLPQLKFINMVSYGNEWAYPFIESFLRQLKVGQIKSRPQDPRLGPLREVALNWAGTEGGLELYEVLPYLAVSSVTEFRGRMIRLQGLLGHSRMQVFHTTAVSLAASSLDARAMVSFLSCFHSLKRFEYEHRVTMDGDRIFSPWFVNKGLTNSEHCLEELVLSNDDRYVSPGPVDLHPLGPLARFVKLRVLEVDARTLLGYEVYEEEEDLSPPNGEEEEYKVLSSFLKRVCLEQGKDVYPLENYHPSVPALRFFRSPGLPPSLEHLTVTKCHNLILNCMVELLLAPREKLLKLKTLKLQFDFYCTAYKWHGTKWEEAALEQGIILTRQQYTYHTLDTKV